MIIIFALPLGCALDYFKISAVTKLTGIALATFGLLSCYISLIIAAKIFNHEISITGIQPTNQITLNSTSATITATTTNVKPSEFDYHTTVGYSNIIIPTVIVFLLGICYNFCNILFWGTLTQVTNADTIVAASGVISSFMNVVPALLPVLITWTLGANDGHGELLVLALVALFSCVCAARAACLADRKEDSAIAYSPVDQEG